MSPARQLDTTSHNTPGVIAKYELSIDLALILFSDGNFALEAIYQDDLALVTLTRQEAYQLRQILAGLLPGLV